MSIKRYDPCNDDYEMLDNGAFVLYDDHLAEVERLERAASVYMDMATHYKDELAKVRAQAGWIDAQKVIDAIELQIGRPLSYYGSIGLNEALDIIRAEVAKQNKEEK